MSDLYKKLIDYTDSDYYPFHMPGHKRNFKEGLNPYTYDITEIDGFDNLHEPMGILRIAMEEAARFYESDKTYFLVNGSTCGLLSAICALTAKNDRILVARNCHKAVYNAIYLNELQPVYIYPEYIEEFGVYGGISPYKIQYFLDENPDIRVVVITSPTYEGVVSNIEKIAEIVHEKKGVLIVDEAHGAHFGMHADLPKTALSQGADVVIQSLHKTLPALTQTALLHIKSSRVEAKQIEEYLRIYQTSSPSYVLMASITECINTIKGEGIFLFEPYVRRLMVMLKHAKEFTHIKLMDKSIVGKNSVADFDISKFVISLKGTGHTGRWLYDNLLERFHLQLEMCSGDYAIAMTSIMDSEEGLLRLFKALVELDRDLRVYGEDLKKSTNEMTLMDYRLPTAIVSESISAARGKESEPLKLERAAGKISTEYVYLYPPGIPVIAPGEIVTGEVISLIQKYKKSGLQDDFCRPLPCKI